MTVDVLAGAVAAATSVALLLPSRSVVRRLRVVCPKPGATSGATARGGQRPRDDGLTRRGAALLAAVAAALVVGGPAGLLAGAVTGVALLRAFTRLEPAVRRERRVAIGRDLPVAMDLLSACLSAGTPVAAAVRAVAASVRGPLAEEFGAVLAAMELGVPPAEAWLSLPADGFGSVGRTIARATTSGAPLADMAAAVADERRAALQTDATAAARRAGVSAVGPLGLCFLPAFLATAVVPVVVGLATRVLA